MIELPPEPTGFRARVADFMDSNRVQHTITAVIVFNAVTLGLETSATVQRAFGQTLDVVDDVVIGIFVIELALKIFGQGWRFFTRAWNIFDFVIVGISLVPSSGPLSVLRALRVLRIFRLVSVVPAMRRVVSALLSAIPGVSSVVLLMLLVFYVFSVMATKLFGEAFPKWFGTVGESMYSLFQIMTLESWSMGIVRPVMEQFPNAWILFVGFILITSFAVLNLFIAVIVNAMQEQHAAEAEEERQAIEEIAHKEREMISTEIAALREELATIRRLAESGKS
jgi:voltage-gated sodium channel